MRNILYQPRVLIMSGPNKTLSKNIGRYYCNLGASVMIAEMNEVNNRITIENLNSQGIKYASIIREFDNADDAFLVFSAYLKDYDKFDLVLNLGQNNDAVADVLSDILSYDGGLMCTPV